MITAGLDGNLWFTEVSGNKIGKSTTAGAITEYSVAGNPLGITAGPDGNLWFTEVSGNKIGKITTSGAVTEYAVPTADSAPFMIVTGPDGSLWFTENFGNKIGRVTTTGTFSEYPIPTGGSGPLGITVGPDSNLWFTEESGNKIGVLNPAQIPTATPTVTPGPSTPTLTPSPASGCAATPLSSCHPPEPGKSLLLLKNSPDDAGDKLSWKWRNSGGPVSLTDLGDPTTVTDYTLCLYAGSATASIAIPAGANWRTAGTTGYVFKDASGSPDGAQKAKVKSGSGSTAKALLKGRGNNLPDTLVPPLALPVIVQLVNDTNAVCFSAFYDTAGLIKNDATQFKGKATVPDALP